MALVAARHHNLNRVRRRWVLEAREADLQRRERARGRVVRFVVAMLRMVATAVANPIAFEGYEMSVKETL